MDFYNQKWVSSLWGRPSWAVTIGGCTFYSVSEIEVDSKWRRHEDEHKRQWRRGWYIGFLVKYLYYNMRLGYWNNPYEVAAREASEKNG